MDEIEKSYKAIFKRLEEAVNILNMNVAILVNGEEDERKLSVDAKIAALVKQLKKCLIALLELELIMLRLFVPQNEISSFAMYRLSQDK